VGGYTELSALVRDQKLLPAAGGSNSD